MIYKSLGKSDLNISAIAYGAWELDGICWPKITEQESIDVLDFAYQSGINFIDTAPVYGFGKSEKIIGEFIRSIKTSGKKIPLIATKCGFLWDEDKNVTVSLKYDSILRECDMSLERLGIDSIDLYQVHWPDRQTSPKETFKALNRLVDEKKIRWIGVSNYNLDDIDFALKLTDHLTSLQPFYNMFVRGIEKDIVSFCLKNNIGIIPYSPLCQGLLTGKIGKDLILSENDGRKYNSNFVNHEKFSRNITRVEKLKKISDKLEIHLSQMVLSWTLNRSGITGLITGSISKEHIKSNAEAVYIDLDKDVLDEIDKIISDEELKTGISF